MKINALLMHETDNVVTCVREIKKGERVIYRKGNEMCEAVANETIPYCHKMALEDIREDGVVLKYGEMIGKTTEKIEAGHWVSHENIYSVPRDYESEML